MRILLAVMVFMMCTSAFAQRSRVRENVKQQTYVATEKESNAKVEITGVEESSDKSTDQKKSNIRKK